MATTLTDPLLGHVVDGRYEVLSRVARGGMATVYRALDRRLDREVALKVMHAHLAEGGKGAEFAARFRREARSAARLTHPGIVAVYDQGVDGDTSYLTMELVEGGNLRRHLEEHGPLTLREALGLTEQILEALAAAHRVGLVHRDIKPENVLLSGEERRVKVADFGLARAVTEVTSTSTGTVLGTVAYLAPELVTHGTADARTDVYAVGILLYEMVTGRQPFTGATPIQVAYQHVHEDVPAPSGVVPWLPAELDDLVTSTSARLPDERPADAGEALQLLRRARATLDDTELDRAAERPEVPAEPAEDHAVDLDRTTAFRPDLTAALPSGAVPVATEPQGAPTDDDHALRLWRRRVAALLALIAVAALTGIGVVWWNTDGPGAWTTVPDGLVDVPLAQAEAVLTDAGLTSTTTEAYDPEIAAGHVVGTDPAVGERVRRDGTVGLVVSLGPEMTTVPVLVDLTQEQAATALEEARLALGDVSTAYHDTVPAGTVLEASAEPETELAVDSTVDLVVSDGPAPVTILSVVGVTEEDATAQLEAEGLGVERAEDYSEQYAAGVVMAQSPEAGAAGHHRGDTVTITVSLGPPLVEVPNVTGFGFAAAKAALEEVGLVVERQNIMGAPGGYVLEQSIPAGREVPKGSTVVVKVF